jgi:hypothetical protein
VVQDVPFYLCHSTSILLSNRTLSGDKRNGGRRTSVANAKITGVRQWAGVGWEGDGWIWQGWCTSAHQMVSTPYGGGAERRADGKG